MESLPWCWSLLLLVMMMMMVVNSSAEITRLPLLLYFLLVVFQRTRAKFPGISILQSSLKSSKKNYYFVAEQCVVACR